jgi:hypothetical protein
MFVHNLFKVFFLSFKLFSFLAKAFLSVVDVQAFFAVVSDVAALASVVVADEEEELPLDESSPQFFGFA